MWTRRRPRLARSTPRRTAVAVLLAGALAAAAAAQEAPPPPPPAPDTVKGSLGAGLALTSGNSDTRSFNVNFTFTWDPGRKNIFKAEGLYLRTDQDGQAEADKTSLQARDEYKLSRRTFVFGELRYLRDRFKELDYLVSPVAGAGYRLVDSGRVQLAFDGALGAAFEKLRGNAATTSFALQAGESLTWELSPSATVTHSVTALWKAEDFGDAVYRLAAGIATTVTSRLELKLSYTRDVKTRPPDPTLEKSDDSLLVALVVKF